ncbi:MAG: hypothetical protein KA175_11820 [Flavobacteriales bacterium]|nr:hypothetical protein [Flavobacteriales bacterium]MBP6698299.1 hypothetical protein [Flavobacteriales bacterium]
MKLRYTLPFLLALMPFVSSAQAANDNCSGAVDLDLSSPADCLNENLTVNFSNSTISTNPPFCDAAGSQIRDFWYRFYSGNSTTVTIYLASSQSSHIGFGVYTSCGTAAYACLTNVDGYVDIPVSQNTLYYLQIYTLVNSNPSNSGFFCLHWNNAPPAPPANDECVGATLLTPAVSCDPTAGIGLWATGSGVSTNCFQGADDDDLWYRFIAPNEEVTITVDGGGDAQTGYDPAVQLGLYTGCAGTMTNIFCVDDTGPGGIEVVNAGFLNPGITFYIRVWDVDGSQPVPGDLTICVQRSSGLGVEDHERNGWNLIPSPNGYLIKPPDGASGTAQFRILDVFGREQVRRTMVASGVQPLAIEVLPAATYLMLIEHGGSRFIQRIVLP